MNDPYSPIDAAYRAAYTAAQARLTKEGASIPSFEEVDWDHLQTESSSQLWPLDFIPLWGELKQLPPQGGVVARLVAELRELISETRSIHHARAVLAWYTNQSRSPLANGLRAEEASLAERLQRITLLAQAPDRWVAWTSGVYRTDYPLDWPEASLAGRSLARFSWVEAKEFGHSPGNPQGGRRLRGEKEELLARFGGMFGAAELLADYRLEFPLPAEEAPPEAYLRLELYGYVFAVRFELDPQPLEEGVI